MKTKASGSIIKTKLTVKKIHMAVGMHLTVISALHKNTYHPPLELQLLLLHTKEVKSTVIWGERQEITFIDLKFTNEQRRANSVTT